MKKIISSILILSIIISTLVLPTSVMAAEKKLKVDKYGFIVPVEKMPEPNQWGFINNVEAPDPNAIVIYDVNGLRNIKNNLSGSYILGCDIDFSSAEYNWEPIGDYENPFVGTLDGQGYKINNFCLTQENRSGIFGYVSKATIKNIGLSVPTGKTTNGGFISNGSGGNVIDNCFLSGDNTGYSICYMRGYGNKVKNCYVTGNMSGTGLGYLGGGNYSGNEVINCFVKGDINAEGSVAGLVYISDKNTVLIENCFYEGNINVKNIAGGYVAGIVASSDFDWGWGNVNNCYAKTNITVIGQDRKYLSTANNAYVSGVGGGPSNNCYHIGDISISGFPGISIHPVSWYSCENAYFINNVEYTRSTEQSLGGIGGVWLSLPSGSEEGNCFYSSNIETEKDNWIKINPNDIEIIFSGIKINGSDSCAMNNEVVLNATRYDENGSIAPEGGITWTCDNESIAQITPWGNNVTVKGLKGGKVTITAIHAESGMSATHELEVKDDMQISINAMKNADGIKTKYIDAMKEEKLSINVTNLPENTVPEIEVEVDKKDFLDVGELKEVPVIQTEATGIAKQYELPIKGLQNGKIKVTAILKTEQETKEDTAEIIIRSPKVYNNNIELTFGKVLPYIENERMFVGAEKFFGLVGGSAQENGKTVTGTHNNTTYTYIAEHGNVKVNDGATVIDNLPTVENTAEGEKIYIPLRFTAENYDGYVQWNNDEYAAYITDDERSAYISKIKKYCYDYSKNDRLLYLPQQQSYEKLMNNDLYLSYLFMKEYSEIDTSSLSAFMTDVTKKGIINTTALVFNDEMWTRLWNYLKASHSDPTMFVDGVDEVEKEKYKDALKSYIENTHQKRTTDKIVEVIDNVTDPLKSAKGSISAATSPIKLDLKIEASADDLKETRKMLTDLGVSSDLSDVSDYAKNVDNILDEFDTLSAVGTVSDVAGWGFILTDGLSDMMKTLGNYNTMNEYVSELDSMSNNTSLPASLREAAKELKAEISGNIDDAIRAPLKRMFDAAGEEVTSDGLKTIASGTGATVAAQIFAGVSIAKFIGNLTAGVDDVIKNISYVQMWGLLQKAEVEKLNSLASEFNKLYKAEKDIDEVYAAAEKVEESYLRLHNYRLQGEQTYRYLQSGDYAVIDLQSLTGSGDNVEYADNNIKMLNDISFK